MLKSIKRTVVFKLLNPLKAMGKQKVFGIGYNKTGTTSLKKAMYDLKFTIGEQRKAERLLLDWSKRDFKNLVKYCKSAQFFQDIPFSKPYTFIALDQEFSNSRFILTVRDTPEQWYNSITKFHAKKWGRNGRVPISEDLKNAKYIYKGWAWESMSLNYNISKEAPYEKEVLIDAYNKHIDIVKDYFKHRPNDLLVLNVAEDGAYKKLCDFLGIQTELLNFPWENKTSEVKIK